MKPNQIDIHITDKASFDTFERANILNYLQRFAQKVDKMVNAGTINLHIKQNNKKYRRVPNYHCTIRFWTDKDYFATTNEDYGYLPTIHGALIKIEKLFIKKRKRRIPKIIAHQLKKIRKFPAMI